MPVSVYIYTRVCGCVVLSHSNTKGLHDFKNHVACQTIDLRELQLLRTNRRLHELTANPLPPPIYSSAVASRHRLPCCHGVAAAAVAVNDSAAAVAVAVVAIVAVVVGCC